MHKKHNTGGGWYRWQVRNAELETHLTRDGTNKLKSAIEALDRDDKRFLVFFCFPFPSVV